MFRPKIRPFPELKLLGQKMSKGIPVSRNAPFNGSWAIQLPPFLCPHGCPVVHEALDTEPTHIWDEWRTFHWQTLLQGVRKIPQH
jgi:hypothetical protein